MNSQSGWYRTGSGQSRVGAPQCYLAIFTACKQNFGQGNIFSSTCQEFCSRGRLPQCMLGYYTPREQKLPPEQTPLEADTPQKQTDPPAQCMLGDTVCVLLECNLVFPENCIKMKKTNGSLPKTRQCLESNFFSLRYDLNREKLCHGIFSLTIQNSNHCFPWFYFWNLVHTWGKKKFK